VHQGVNLSAYNTQESAADIEDLRIALGYQQLNLYGVSYGSLLVLDTMRFFPQSVRSAVIDGVVPPQLQPCGDPEYRWLHSPRWWARHLARSGLVEVDLADMVPDGWLHWLRWERRAPLAEVLARDAGRTLGFTRVVARRSRSRGPRSGADGRMLGGETVSWADFVH